MYLYCERALYNMKENTQEVILDFYCEKDMLTILEMFKIKDTETNQTTLLLNGVLYEKYKGFRNGNWYELSSDFFQLFEQDNTGELDSSRIFAELKYKSNHLLNLQSLQEKNDEKI